MPKVSKGSTREDVVGNLPKRLQIIYEMIGFPIWLGVPREKRPVYIVDEDGLPQEGMFLSSNFHRCFEFDSINHFLTVLKNLNKGGWVGIVKKGNHNIYYLTKKAKRYFEEFGSFTNPDGPLMNRWLPKVITETETVTETETEYIEPRRIYNCRQEEGKGFYVEIVDAKTKKLVKEFGYFESSTDAKTWIEAQKNK